MIDLEPLEWEELPDLMSIQELRRYLRIGDRQARDWAKEHGIYLKIGGSARVRKEDVAEALQSEKKEDGSPQEMNRSL